MTHDERERLTVLEIKQEAMAKKQDEIADDVKETRKVVESLALDRAKAGGFIIALTAVATFIGFVLANLKTWLFTSN